MQDRQLAQRLLERIHGSSYRPATPDELARELCRDERQRDVFHHTLEDLRVRGRIVLNKRRQVLAASPSSTVSGTYRGTRHGYGFCVPDHPGMVEDVFIPPGKNADALPGDQVLVRLRQRGKRDGRMRVEGCVLEVLERGRGQFVGALQRTPSAWLVLADGGGLPSAIHVPDAPASGAREGDQVVVQILRYPIEGLDATGVIVEVLGVRGTPGVDALSVLREHEIPDRFPEACLEQARRAAVSFDPEPAMEGRVDLRELLVVTIDPRDARDFDDAVSVEACAQGWELGVHIADVAVFVPAGSALDEQARLRGNSVYLPGHVVPMLPEMLSNGVCSLQEGVPRLTKSVFMRYDAEGQLTAERSCNSVIQSRKRLTYEEATLVLEGRTGGIPSEVCALLGHAERLARTIAARRRRAGMISLKLPEAELVLADDGCVAEVRQEDDSYSHTIIEMFMVEANEAVARRLHRRAALPLRRVHPDPNETSARQLRDFLKVLGFKAPADMEPTALQDILDASLNTPEAFNVHYAVLRAMQPAVYSPEELGHFALASQHYTHFTSPIRRYPDLAIHRALDQDFAGSAPAEFSAEGYHGLAELGLHCSETERRAEQAERDLRTIKLLRWLEPRLGSDEPGVVTGVVQSGVFVRLSRYLIDGFVRLEDLPQQPWEVFREAFCAVHLSSGRRITIGDQVKVRLARVDLALRRLELQLLEQVTTRGGGVPPRATRRTVQRGARRTSKHKPRERRRRR